MRLWMIPVLVGLLSGCGGPAPTVREDKVYLHTVAPGETLDEIADRYYGNPGQGDVIEAFNEIDEGELRPGMVLRVPMNAKDLEHLALRQRAREPYNRGVGLAEEGSFLDAVQMFQEALAIDPEFVDARYNLGVTFQKLKSYDKARREFERIVERRSDNGAYQFALGNSYFHLSRYDKAVGAFEKAVAIDPGHLKAQYSLAVCYEKIGEGAKAREAWKRYLELDTTSVWASEARKRLKGLE